MKNKKVKTNSAKPYVSKQAILSDDAYTYFQYYEDGHWFPCKSNDVMKTKLMLRRNMSTIDFI